jgi:hypothetical protein
VRACRAVPVGAPGSIARTDPAGSRYETHTSRSWGGVASFLSMFSIEVDHEGGHHLAEGRDALSDPSQLWQAWQRWCAENNVGAGHQRAFGVKMTARFARESNNNRPRYPNVRVRQPGSKIGLVASNWVHYGAPRFAGVLGHL